MKLAKMITLVALTTVAASTSFAAKAKCDHRGQSGMFANTNPAPKYVDSKKVVTASAATVKGTK